MNFKEIYLSIETIDHDISLIMKDLEEIKVRARNWDATINFSALIVTDLQNYFLSPDSHAFIPSAPAILPNIKKLIRFFRENKRPVIFTKHTNNAYDSGSMSYWWNDLINPEKNFAELSGGLYEPGDIIINKHQYDAFQGTDLELILKGMGIMYPVTCGVMANLCCETTVRSAFVRGFRPVLPVDATAAYNRQFHLSTFCNLVFGFSPLLTTEEIIIKLFR